MFGRKKQAPTAKEQAKTLLLNAAQDGVAGAIETLIVKSVTGTFNAIVNGVKRTAEKAKEDEVVDLDLGRKPKADDDFDIDADLAKQSAGTTAEPKSEEAAPAVDEDNNNDGGQE